MINQQIQQILQQQKNLQESLERCLSQVKIEDHSDNDNQKSDEFNEKIDTAFLNDFEVQDHYLSSFNNDIKNDYVYVLLEVLKSSSEGISEMQYTLLILLLKSMHLEHESKFYFEGAKTVDSDLLERLADCVKIDSEIGSALIADILILFRSVGVLDNSKINVISRLLDLFGLSPQQLTEIDNIASSIIGTSVKGQFEKIAIEETITHPDEDKWKEEGFRLLNQKYVVLEICEGNINKKGDLLINLQVTANKERERSNNNNSKTTSSFWGAMANITEGFLTVEEQCIYATQVGYFFAKVTVGEEFSCNHKTYFGDIVIVPEYFNFWYSFIDLETMIKESL